MSAEQEPSEVRKRLQRLTQEATEALQRSADTEKLLSHTQVVHLLEVTRSLNNIRDRERLLHFVNEKMREFFDAENAFVVLFGPGETMRIYEERPVSDPAPAPHEDAELPLSRTILNQVRNSREPLLIDDCNNIQLLRSQRSIRRLKLSSVMCVPLIVNEIVIGVLQFDQRGHGHAFPPSDLKLLTLFASQVATAMRNMQLVECLERSYREMRDAQSALLQAEHSSILRDSVQLTADEIKSACLEVFGTCGALLAKGDLDPGLRSGIERLNSGVEVANAAIDRLEQLAASGRTDLYHESDLNAVVGELPFRLRHKLQDMQRRGVGYRLVVDKAEVPRVAAHETEVREILTWMIDHAMTVMPRGGTIVVTTALRDEQVCVLVRDEGPGLDEREQSTLFDPASHPGFEGSHGFALASSRALARRLGGEVTLDQTGATGTTLALWLKVADARAASIADRPGSALRPQVLLVEDDEHLCAVIGQLLRSMNVQAVFAPNGSAALEACSSEVFDAVLTNRSMPGLSGIELARALRFRYPRLPIVLMSGSGGSSTEQLLPEDRVLFAALLHKPFALDDLRALIGRILPQSASM